MMMTPVRRCMQSFAREHTLIYGRSRLIPLDQIVTRSATDFKSERRGLFYAESWLLTHYLMDKAERRSGLAAYLQLLPYRSSEAAWKEAFGEDIKTTQATLWAYGSSNPEFLRVAWERTWPTPKVRVTSIMPAEAAEMILTIGMKVGGRPKTPAQLVDGLERIAALA